MANSPATALSSCEVWGVHPAAQQQRRKLAAQHRGYVRSICRLPTGVPLEALMAELGRTDIEARWLAHSLRFWNSLCAQSLSMQRARRVNVLWGFLPRIWHPFSPSGLLV